MDFAQYWYSPGEGEAPGFSINNSLRFRGSQVLTRLCAATPSNIYESTVSFWMKKADPVLGAAPADIQYLLEGYYTTGNRTILFLNSSYAPYGDDDSVRCLTIYSNAQIGGTPGSAPLRDPSAWYHVVYQIQSAPSTGTCTVYINGEQVDRLTVTSTNNYPFFPWWNGTPSGGGVAIGRTYGTAANYFDGYLAEFHMVPSIRLPSDFGEYNAQGVWVPKEYTGGGYGINGFYLDFSDPSDIGADRSDSTTPTRSFTPNGFDLSDPTSDLYDHMEDSPTQNYATINPLETSWFAGGGATNNSIINANLSSYTNDNNHNRLTQYPQAGQKLYMECVGSNYYVGFVPQDYPVGTDYIGSTASRGVGFYKDGNTYFGSAIVGSNPAFTTSDLIQLAYDVDTGNIWMGVNGTWHNSGDPATGANPTYTLPFGEIWQFAFNEKSAPNSLNPGQRPFLHTPPTGFKSLQAQNLPAAPIQNGRDHFQAITGPGANILTAAQTAFPNGLWWIKDRANANQHRLVDSINTVTDVMQSPARNVGNAYAAPAGNSVAWCWATPAGGINTTAGFSITNGTHGLNEVPEFVIDRNLNVFLASVTAGNGFVLSSDAALAAQPWTVNATTVTGPAGGTYYAWHSVPGYSAFGSYTGNGSANGPFIYTGFRPAFVLIKANSSYDWIIVDSTRDPSNPCNNTLIPNKVDVEAVGTPGFTIDMLSNGFKIRNNGSTCNLTNNIYHYAAFAENPFQSPVTAR